MGEAGRQVSGGGRQRGRAGEWKAGSSSSSRQAGEQEGEPWRGIIGVAAVVGGVAVISHEEIIHRDRHFIGGVVIVTRRRRW